MNVNNYEEYYKALKSRKEAYTKNNDTGKDSSFFSAGSTVAVQMKDRGPQTYGVITEGNGDNHQGQSYQMWMKKDGQSRVTMQNMKHIRYTQVKVEKYLRDQTAKTSAYTPIASWGTDPTNHHGISCDPYIYMYMNQDTYMRQSNNDGYSDNSNDKTHSMDPEQGNAGLNNPNVSRVEDNTGTKMWTCHKVSLVVGWK